MVLEQLELFIFVLFLKDFETYSLVCIWHYVLMYIYI